MHHNIWFLSTLRTTELRSLIIAILFEWSTICRKYNLVFMRSTVDTKQVSNVIENLVSIGGSKL